jgi:glucose uptake protein
MVVFSTICWGSWANTFKGVRNYRFDLFYWDYAIGAVLISLILAFTMGSVQPGPTGFFANMLRASRGTLVSAAIGGVLYGLGNLLLVAGIERVGLAIAFPVSIGLALVVGVVLSYILQPIGQPALLALGVAFALIAVTFDSRAYRAIRGPIAGASQKSLSLCIVAGILIGLGPPFLARALTAGRPLGPYGTSVFFTFGVLLSCLSLKTYAMRKPLSGSSAGGGTFFGASARNHLLGIAGGSVSGTGVVFNLVAAHFTGVAISYAVGQAAPMVAALWGVFAWHEFRGADHRAKTYLSLMFIFYVLAILTVSAARKLA